MKNKPLMWVLVIVGVSLAGYVTYSLMKPKAPTNNPLFSSSDISGIADIFSGIFKKKDPAIDYSVNEFDRPLGTAADDVPFQEVQEG